MWFIIIVAVVVAVVMIVLFSRSRISSLKIKHKSDIDEIRKSIASVSMRYFPRGTNRCERNYRSFNAEHYLV